MEKENIASASASASRRSAIVERIRIREEWCALKGADSLPPPKGKPKEPKRKRPNLKEKITKTMQQPKGSQSEPLRGVVALVSVGAEARALPLRAALSALGATVVSQWNALVTHLVWAEGGCRTIRAKARLLASHLVSPLWVEACAAAAERLPERAFPAAARHSDLPSPRTLRRLLKRAEMENIPLVDLLTESSAKPGKEPSRDARRQNLAGDKDAQREKVTQRERRASEDSKSSEDAADTSKDTSKDMSRDKTTDNSRDTTATDVDGRVNTGRRRALPAAASPRPPKRSRRKLFTQKEVADDGDSSATEDEAAANKLRTPSRITQRERKILARAERMAQRIVRVCGWRGGGAGRARAPQPARKAVNYYVVLTGMSRSERHLVSDAVRKLGGRLQTHVNRKTTHVLLGSCRDDHNENAAFENQNGEQANESNAERNVIESIRVGRDITNSLELDDVRNNDLNDSVRNTAIGHILVENIRKNIERNNADDDIVKQLGTMNIETNNTTNQTKHSNDVVIVNNNNEVIDIVTDSNNSINNNEEKTNKNDETNLVATNLTSGRSGVARTDRLDTSLARNQDKSMISGINVLNTSDGQSCGVRIPFCDVKKARTLNALLGAARGCRVLYGQWALDSLAENHWIHHQGYEVRHLKKTSQNARVERLALERTRSEFGYDVFNGIRVKLSANVEQRNAAIELLTLCGGIIVNPDGAQLQNGRQKIDIAQKNRQNCVLTQVKGMTQRHIPRNEALLQYSWLSQDGALGQDGGRDQDGGQNQNGGRRSVDYDILLGSGVGEISSKWVFDSVAAGRMRTIRRYVNKV